MSPEIILMLMLPTYALLLLFVAQEKGFLFSEGMACPFFQQKTETGAAHFSKPSLIQHTPVFYFLFSFYFSKKISCWRNIS